MTLNLKKHPIECGLWLFKRLSNYSWFTNEQIKENGAYVPSCIAVNKRSHVYRVHSTIDPPPPTHYNTIIVFELKLNGTKWNRIRVHIHGQQYGMPSACLCLESIIHSFISEMFALIQFTNKLQMHY